MIPAVARSGVLAPALLVVAAATVGAVLMFPGAYRALPSVLPDSETYLDWNAGRTPAYPLALTLVRLVSTDVGVLGWLQLAILIAATLSLARAFCAVYRSQFAAAGLAAAILLHPQIVSYAFTVLPESLFMSTLMLHFTYVLKYVRTPAPRWLVGTGTTLALLILLKPSGYALCACVPLLALFRARWVQALARVALPLAVVLLCVSAINLVLRGYFAPQAQGGYSLVAHVGALVDAGDERYPAVASAIAGDAAPHREAIDAIESLELYYLFTSHDYHALERIVRRRIAEASEARRGVRVTDQRQFPNDPALLQDLTTIGGGLARRAILDHPGAYARHVAAQYYGLWMLPLIQPRERATRLERAIDDIRRASPGVDVPTVAFRVVPWYVFVAVRVLLAMSFALSMGSIISFVWTRATSWLPAAYAAVAVHATFLLVAGVQPGLPRYALVMWPAIALVIVTSAQALRSRALGAGEAS